MHADVTLKKARTHTCVYENWVGTYVTRYSAAGSATSSLGTCSPSAQPAPPVTPPPLRPTESHVMDMGARLGTFLLWSRASSWAPDRTHAPA